jgi:hypothetical protein
MEMLKSDSRASASEIVFKHSFSVYEYPRVTWRWKAENVYEKGNATGKSGDDYPIRFYMEKGRRFKSNLPVRSICPTCPLFDTSDFAGLFLAQ